MRVSRPLWIPQRARRGLSDCHPIGAAAVGCSGLSTRSTHPALLNFDPHAAMRMSAPKPPKLFISSSVKRPP